jgi:hypothetical protein
MERLPATSSTDGVGAATFENFERPEAFGPVALLSPRRFDRGSRTRTRDPVGGPCG